MTPTVTGLRERKRGRVAVELDGKPWRVLPADAVVRAGLAVGRDAGSAHGAGAGARGAPGQSAGGGDAIAGGERPVASGRSSGGWRGRAIPPRRVKTRSRLSAVPGSSTTPAWRRIAPSCSRAAATAMPAIRADLRRRLISADTAADAVAALEPELERARRLLAGQSVTPAMLRRLSGRGFSRDTLEEVATAFAQEA